MGDFDDLTIDDLSDIVSADKLREMGCQADAWQGLAYLFDSQLARLREAVDALSGGWRGPAGAAFAAEVGRIQQTLTRGREVALGNASAWSQAVDQATAARDVIYQIEGEYRAALGQAASDYERQKAEADSSWLNNPATGFFVDYPDKPDAAAIRAEYDQRGRAVMEYASGVYEEVYRTIQDAPAYDGPAGVWSPVDPWGDGMVLSGRSSRLSGTSGTPPLNAPVDLGNAPTGSAGPTLAGTAIPAAPAQVGTNPAAAALPGTGSPGTAGMGGLFPSTMTGTGRSTPRLPAGVRGATWQTGRGAGSGSRPASPAAGAPGTRTGLGAGSGKATPAASRSVTGRARPSTAADNQTTRPAGASGRPGNRAKHEPEVQADTPQGNEVWEVEEGVPAVVEPPVPYNPRDEWPGPHLGQKGERL